jgi:hypothetical protein
MTLLHHTTPPTHPRQGVKSRLLEPQDGQMLTSLFVRKARSAHDLTAQAQRKLRTVVSELFPASEKQQPPSHTRTDLISRLPEELMIAILCYLDGSSIAACNRVRLTVFRFPLPTPARPNSSCRLVAVCDWPSHTVCNCSTKSRSSRAACAMARAETRTNPCS